jgi:hypothetical protein
LMNRRSLLGLVDRGFCRFHMGDEMNFVLLTGFG